MVDIYEEIYSGLHSLAEGISANAENNLTSSQASLPKAHLEVDTTLRAEFHGDPKALGMDSSGFPIDSADYESFGHYSSMDSGSCEQEATPSSLSFDEDYSRKSSTVCRRRFSAFRNWHLRVPSDGESPLESSEPDLSMPEKICSISSEENKDDDDDEDYFA